MFKQPSLLWVASAETVQKPKRLKTHTRGVRPRPL